ncbi:hypothetical protein EV702DRAFT_495039 [Suillus placidus]|uniref:Uncharacterized protein n=1 Tax=Suillus placidus TaxID=48579 RepID=A0A9P7A4G9_9AGAM|nr:hypothetical protein EV702DRAFT_495039 [Suillus placidus]
MFSLFTFIHGSLLLASPVPSLDINYVSYLECRSVFESRDSIDIGPLAPDNPRLEAPKLSDPSTPTAPSIITRLHHARKHPHSSHHNYHIICIMIGRGAYASHRLGGPSFDVISDKLTRQLTMTPVMTLHLPHNPSEAVSAFGASYQGSIIIDMWLFGATFCEEPSRYDRRQ